MNGSGHLNGEAADFDCQETIAETVEISEENFEYATTKNNSPISNVTEETTNMVIENRNAARVNGHSEGSSGLSLLSRTKPLEKYYPQTNGINGCDLNEDSCDTSSIGTVETETSQSSTSRPRPSKNKKRKPNVKRRSKMPYNLTCHFHESDKQPIFGVTFNPHLQQNGKYIFATASSNRISFYECLREGPESVVLLQVYADPDPDESFYCIAWSYDDVSKMPLVAAAGYRGIIRIISPSAKRCVKHFKGHGHSINDLKFHPHDSNLLLSVSKDLSLRIWNIKTDICVAIFGGVEGHRDEVLSADFHASGTRIVSCGMDHSLKIWATDIQEIDEAIQDSYTYNSQKADKPFKTARCQIPAFTTRDIHRNYVDCVRWLGNFIMSKSCENAIVLWKPGKLENESDIALIKDKYIGEAQTTIVHEFLLNDSEIWFMRFSMDFKQNTMALGNMKGKTYVWDLDPEDVSRTK